MSNFNHLAEARRGYLSTAGLHIQPELQHLLATLRTVLGQLQTGGLTAAKPRRPRRAVRAKVAYGMTGDGKSHFWARQNPKDPAWDPTFPASFKLGNSARSPTVWFEDEIETWLELRASASRKLVQAMPQDQREGRVSTKVAVDMGVMQ